MNDSIIKIDIAYFQKRYDQIEEIPENIKNKAIDSLIKLQDMGIEPLSKIPCLETLKALAEEKTPKGSKAESP